MAELKIRDEEFQSFPEIDEPIEDFTIFEEVQRPEMLKVPTSPASKLSKLSKIEQILIVSFVLSAVILGVLTINLRTQVSSAENEITAIQAKTNEATNKKMDLQQEKNELSKTERIQKIAEKKGLSIKEDNLRNVK